MRSKSMWASRPLNIVGFLGLVSAHFDIEKTAKGYSDIVTELNAGIAVITPAESIRELLFREDIVEDREKRKARGKRQEPTAPYASAMQAGGDASELRGSRI